MPLIDMPLDDLERYRPDLPMPDDFRQFWDRTLTEARSVDAAPTFLPIDTGLSLVTTEDVTFPGFGGQPVRGWFHRPANASGPLPVVVEYIGYGAGRGLPHQPSLFANAGYAHFIMDTRGQGSAWWPGATPDADVSAGDPCFPGFMTRGITDPERYFYRRVFTDAVRAVDAVRTHPMVDPSKVIVSGGSQGGGITLAVAGLVPDLLAVAPDVPFLCDFPRGITFNGRDPYGEVAKYLKTHRDSVDIVLRTLSYHDGVNLGQFATAPALFSVGLMDEVCPPSTVYAAYHAYGSTGGGVAGLAVYPFNDHEGGEMFHTRRKLDFIREIVAVA